MFISSFFSFIATVLLWFLGIAATIFVLPMIYFALKAAFSALKNRKRKFKPPKRYNGYFDQYRTEKIDDQSAPGVSNCSISDTSLSAQYSRDDHNRTTNETDRTLQEEIAYIRRLGKSAVNSANKAVDSITDSTNSSIQEVSDYEKHKKEVYYQVRDKILSEGEELLKPHLQKFIDSKKYILIDSPNYSRYLKPTKRDDKKFEDISASKIKGLVGDFGIETLDGKPVCIIEYDDSTHLAEDRIARDNFLFSACKFAEFPRITITSKEYNSLKEQNKYDMHYFYTLLYKKFFEACGNPLNLPSLTCDKCHQEFYVNAGSYGLFLSHGRHNECDNKINIIGDNTY